LDFERGVSASELGENRRSPNWHGATKWGNFGWKRGIANDPNFQPSISAFLLIIGDSNYQ
jgi:hypothetical protein